MPDHRNDCTVLGENFTDALQSGSRDFFAGTIALGFMLYISIPVTFVALLVVPSTTYLSFKYGEYQRKIGKVTQESIGEMTKVRSPPLTIISLCRPADFIPFCAGCRGEALVCPNHRRLQRSRS